MFERISYHISGVASAIGGAISYCYGSCDTILVCLFGCIVLDYASGVIVAGYEHKLSSEIGFKGILKKCWILLMVGLAGLLDKSIGLEVARTMVCCFYICNEAISIIENGTKLGMPFPKKLLELITARRDDSEETQDLGRDIKRDRYIEQHTEEGED